MIAMLLEVEYTKDIRVRKEAESMAAGGLAVLVVVPWTKGMKREEEIKGVKILRIGKNYTHRRKGITDLISSILFVNWMYLFAMKKIIRTHNIQHLHVHDLPLAKTAYKLRKRIPGKVILDSHENYPELLEALFMTKKSVLIHLKNRLFFSPKRWKRYEASILPKMDYLIVVIDEMHDKFIKSYNLDPKSVMVVSNYEKIEFAEKAKELEGDDEFTFEQDSFYLVYVGGIGPMRGLETVIQSMRNLAEHRIEFLILGGGSPDYINTLKQMAVEVGAEKNIHFLGYKPFATVNYFMQSANVNVVPHIRNGHTDCTIPHKLFQIFLSKTPVLVSSCKPLERMVNECNGGWVFEASNPDALAQRVLEIHSADSTFIKQHTNRAYEKAMNEWNWEREGGRLVNFYKTI